MNKFWLVVISIVVGNTLSCSYGDIRSGSRICEESAVVQPMFSIENIKICDFCIHSQIRIPVSQIIVFPGSKEAPYDSRAVWNSLTERRWELGSLVWEHDSSEIGASRSPIIDKFWIAPIDYIFHYHLRIDFSGGSLATIGNGYSGRDPSNVYRFPVLGELGRVIGGRRHAYPSSFVSPHFAKLQPKNTPRQSSYYKAEEREHGHDSFKPRQSQPSWFRWIHVGLGLLLCAIGLSLFVGGSNGWMCSIGLASLAIGWFVMAHGFYLLL